MIVAGHQLSHLRAFHRGAVRIEFVGGFLRHASSFRMSASVRYFVVLTERSEGESNMGHLSDALSTAELAGIVKG